MNTIDQQDCISNISRIEELLLSGIFEPENDGHLLQQSAFIELMIRLRDLLAKVEKYGESISFKDDVMVNKYVHDISDLIKSIRDACCHIDSFKRHIDENKNRGSFLIARGKCNLMRIGNIELKSEYEDDVAVFYGNTIIYFKRHIVRVFNEIKMQLSPLIY